MKKGSVIVMKHLVTMEGIIDTTNTQVKEISKKLIMHMHEKWLWWWAIDVQTQSSYEKTKVWYPNSGCSNHMTRKKTLFHYAIWINEKGDNIFTW